MTVDLDAIRLNHGRWDPLSRACLCGHPWPCDTAKVLDHYDGHTPTQWAYDQACKALEKQRERAQHAEAKLDRARQANDIDRHKELLARGSCHDREIQDVLYEKLITTWRVDEDWDRYEADCATCNWRTDGLENPVKEAGYEHIARVHMAYLDEVIAPILLLEADQRVGAGSREAPAADEESP